MKSFAEEVARNLHAKTRAEDTWQPKKIHLVIFYQKP